MDSQIDALTVLEGYTSPTIQLDQTVGVVDTEGLEKTIVGAQPMPKRIEW